MSRSVRIALGAWLTVMVARNSSATPLTVTYTDGVTGWEWAELTETLGFTYDQIKVVCAQDGLTACTADIGAVGFQGWVWATRDQVRDLFVNATDLTAAQMSDYIDGGNNSTFAPQFLQLFAATGNTFIPASSSCLGANEPGACVWGVSATLRSGTSSFDPKILDYVAVNLPDAATLFPFSGNSDSLSERGVWLYRATDAAAVPEPASLLLLGTGFVGAGVKRLRNRGQRSQSFSAR